jgi:hypothetical protein
MNGLQESPENPGSVREGVVQVLEAIRFQTAVVLLNAAVEAAHTGESGNMGPVRAVPEPCRQLRPQPAPAAPDL